MKADDIELEDFFYTVFDSYGDVIIQHELGACPRWVRRLLEELLDFLFVSCDCDVDRMIR